MNRWLAYILLLNLFGVESSRTTRAATDSLGTKVYIIPVRNEIAPPMAYLVRRGVKEALEAKANLLVLDMDTPGGRVDVTEEIIEILNNFNGQTATFVNKKAFSAGAFISVATQKIFMAPQSVIGAAAPIMMVPGTSPQDMPETMQAKMNSAIRALVRTAAEKNGHNIAVVEAMIDKTKELIVDGKVLNEKGQILTLTNQEAEREYGDPPKALLSSGTVEDIDQLLKKLGYERTVRTYVNPSGAERVAFWINSISQLLLIIGIVGIYIEFKTPGFGLPGIVGIVAFALFFFGGYVAGLSGLEWIVAFLLGLGLVALELFVFPGTTILGVIGAVLMLVSLVMSMVDVYPGMPAIPSFDKLELPLTDLALAFAGSLVAILILSRVLPRTPLYGKLVSEAASGMTTLAELEEVQASRVGQIGVALSTLRPGGKAQFGKDILDVISQGDMIEKGARVKVVGHSGSEAVVEVVA
jgi:membrane-bound serine protease (ClpP class)